MSATSAIDLVTLKKHAAGKPFALAAAESAYTSATRKASASTPASRLEASHSKEATVSPRLSLRNAALTSSGEIG